MTSIPEIRRFIGCPTRQLPSFKILKQDINFAAFSNAELCHLCRHKSFKMLKPRTESTKPNNQTLTTIVWFGYDAFLCLSNEQNWAPGPARKVISKLKDLIKKGCTREEAVAALGDDPDMMHAVLDLWEEVREWEKARE
ncbi:hypothetical protein ACHAP7_011380 [Fusarium lateritium]